MYEYIHECTCFSSLAQLMMQGMPHGRKTVMARRRRQLEKMLAAMEDHEEEDSACFVALLRKIDRTKRHAYITHAYVLSYITPPAILPSFPSRNNLQESFPTYGKTPFRHRFPQ